jgi:large subunit ribosomal protein L7/L12
MADVKSLAEQLVGLTVKEVQELADVLKADYGIEPAAAAVVAIIVPAPASRA